MTTMFERIVGLGSVCIACDTAGRVFGCPDGRRGHWQLPVAKRFVGSADGGEPLAQVCLICDQFPPQPYTARRPA